MARPKKNIATQKTAEVVNPVENATDQVIEQIQEDQTTAEETTTEEATTEVEKTTVESNESNGETILEDIVLSEEEKEALIEQALQEQKEATTEPESTEEAQNPVKDEADEKLELAKGAVVPENVKPGEVYVQKCNKYLSSKLSKYEIRILTDSGIRKVLKSSREKACFVANQMNKVRGFTEKVKVIE